MVWEESIILAPQSVRFAFLSATIPNAREFADWVAKIHGSPCHVVYTGGPLSSSFFSFFFSTQVGAPDCCLPLPAAAQHAVMGEVAQCSAPNRAHARRGSSSVCLAHAWACTTLCATWFGIYHAPPGLA